MCQLPDKAILFSLFILILAYERKSLLSVTGRKMINHSPLEMSRAEILNYFRSTYLNKISSGDKLNEEVYLSEAFLEDLYHKIDNLMPLRFFVKMLMKTKNITDKSDSKGNSMLFSYPGELNQKCSKSSVFNRTLKGILQNWDGDRSIVANQIEEWHAANADTPSSMICNRFRGLTCQYKIATSPDEDNGKMSEVSETPTCQCSGDASIVGFFKNRHGKGKFEPYSDGCYIRPWKPCNHLSVDHTFLDDYYEWHRGLENSRRQLAQMAFPVGRTHRCKEGTYCTDMVPGMKKPICWCTQNSVDPWCHKTVTNPDHRIPVGGELAKLRKKFVKLIIPANDTESICNPEHNGKAMSIMESAGEDPTLTKAVEEMKELAFAELKVRICDFRQSLLCDPESRTCKGSRYCGPGKVHLGSGVCAVNNGFRCQSNEDCVEQAKCRHLPGTVETACVCEKGYGHLCRYEHKSFFSKRFLPIVSGFEGDKFIKLQVEINQVLESWEDNMKKMANDPCDPVTDSVSLEAVKYFGNLDIYRNVTGEDLLRKIKEMLQEGHNLCYYNHFLRCDTATRKCVPLLGDKILSTSPQSVGEELPKITVEVFPDNLCSVKVPKIFQGLVDFTCSRGYICKSSGNRRTCQPDCNSVFAPRERCPNILPEATTKAISEEDENDILLSSRSKKMLINFAEDDNVTGIENRGLPITRDDEPSAPSDVSSSPEPEVSSSSTAESIVESSTDAATSSTEPSTSENSTTAEPETADNTTTTEPETPDHSSTTDLPTIDNSTSSESPNPDNSTTIEPETPDNSTTTEPETTNNSTTIEPETPDNSSTTDLPPTDNSTTSEPSEGPSESSSTISSQPPPPPPPKQKYLSSCKYNDDQLDSSPERRSDTCDGQFYLICVHDVCRCLPGLIHSLYKDTCVVPVGERCGEESIDVPSYMDAEGLTCEYGECRLDNSGRICRPESDIGLILVSIDDGAKYNMYDTDEDSSASLPVAASFRVIMAIQLFANMLSCLTLAIR